MIASLALLSLLVVGLWREPLADGGSSFTRWFEATGSTRQPNGGVPVSAPASASPVIELPLGLAVELHGIDDSQPNIRHLRNAEGLVLRLDIDRSGGGFITLPDDPEHSEIVGVAGRDVLVLFGETRDDVAALYWTDAAVRYQVLVASAPPGGFRLAAALRVAAALMAVDWSVS
jgi:hypothetical protein